MVQPAAKLTKLSLKMLLIACGHVGALFVVYGRRLLAYLPFLGNSADFVWLLLSACAAFYLYYSSLSAAGLVTAPFRRGKLATCSIAATLFSLYWGMFFSVNTYGE